MKRTISVLGERARAVLRIRAHTQVTTFIRPRRRRSGLRAHFKAPGGITSVITGGCALPPTNFEAFMYTASRAWPARRRAPSATRGPPPRRTCWSISGTTYQRCASTPAKRGGGGYFLPSARPRKNGVCKHEKPRRARWWLGGSTTRRSGGRGVDPGCARGGGSRASRPFADAAKPGGDRRNAPRLPDRARARHPVVPVVDGAFPVRSLERARATSPGERRMSFGAANVVRGVRTAG